MRTTLRETDLLDYRFDGSTPDSLWLGRRLVEQWMLDHHVRRDVVGDMLLVVNELCTDAVRHAEDGAVRLKVRVTGRDLEIEVVDWGGHRLGDGAVPDLRVAAALVDEVVLRVDGERSVVRARAHDVVLPPEPPAS